MEEQLNHNQFIIMMVTLWALWKARRDLIHEDIYQSPFATSNFITSFLAELALLDNGDTQKTRGVDRDRRIVWIPPPQGMVKGNCDGAISKENKRSAAATIYRSEEGLFMGASVMVNDGVLDPECVEAMACREALLLRQDLNLRAAVVASDCANVVRSVEEGSRGMSSMVIEEIRRMKMTAGEVSFRYERREANFDAHHIVRKSLELVPGRYVWFLEPPDYVHLQIN